MLAQPHTGPEGTAPHPVDPGTYPGAPPAYPVGQYTSTGQGARPAQVVYQPSNVMLILGVVHDLVGFLILVTSFFSSTLASLIWLSGFVTGIFVVIMGSIVILTSRSPNKGLIIASLVLNILASLEVWWLIINAIVVMIYPSPQHLSSWVGVAVVLLLAGIAEFVVAIAAAVTSTRMMKNQDNGSAQPTYQPEQTVVMTTPLSYGSTQAHPQSYPPQNPGAMEKDTMPPH